MPPSNRSLLMLHWLGVGGADPLVLGGKGAALTHLVQRGLPVPPGFCLTTEAYRVYLEAHDLPPRIAALASALPDEGARAELASFAHAHPLPDAVARVLEEGIARLRDRAPFAVRSSAVGEDSHAASFAGQHETVLGVAAERIEPAVRACWASLWSPRAVAYRVRRGLGFGDAAIAVVVQALVPAEASAVAFTRNPITGADEIVVNAAPGLGEGIVSGTVTPDEIVLDPATFAVRRARPAAGGLVLGAASLAALGALCREAEGAFGAPVDVEAAYAEGRWHLVQARPITTR